MSICGCRSLLRAASLLFVTVPLIAADSVTGPHGMVVAQEPLAADVGLGVLKSGGNAIDAAVAVGFALAVTHPLAGNIGGGGFMMIRLANGESHFLDFRETAPSSATRDMYLNTEGKPTEESVAGWRASGIPGTVAGLEMASKRFGTKRWNELLTPAIRLAAEGFTVDATLAHQLTTSQKFLSQDPESKLLFLRNGRVYRPGDTFKQPELASVLERISKNGARELYAGEVGRRFAAEMKKHGGSITAADLINYTALDRAPLEGAYHDYHLICAPPPSAGGIGILQMLAMLSGTDYASDGPDSPKAVHYMAEAMRRFYADRSEYLGDPRYYKVPTVELLSPTYIERRRQSISAEKATPSNEVKPGLVSSSVADLGDEEAGETTHFNVVDAKGNAVAVTYTLNGAFGSGVSVPGLGFLLNNEMDDFVVKPGFPNMFGLVGGVANSIEPGKRPLSSMSPTIITTNGKLFMVVGAPGGSQITTGVTQVILDVIDFHMNVQDAVDLPRFHHQWKPDFLYLKNGFSGQAESALSKMGYNVRHTDAVARVEAIVVRGTQLEGGTESHLNGKVAAY